MIMPPMNTIVVHLILPEEEEMKKCCDKQKSFNKSFVPIITFRKNKYLIDKFSGVDLC